MSPAPALRTTRRTTLGGVLAGVAVLAGCDLGSGDPASAPAPSADPDDPDAGLLEDVMDDIVATRRVVDSLRRDHGALRRQLGGLARMHDAHLAALGSTRRSGGPSPRSRDTRDPLALLRARELHHQRLLADRASAAQSGRLARLLASMAAAVAQQLAVLPETERGR